MVLLSVLWWEPHCTESGIRIDSLSKVVCGVNDNSTPRLANCGLCAFMGVCAVYLLHAAAVPEAWLIVWKAGNAL